MILTLLRTAGQFVGLLLVIIGWLGFLGSGFYLLFMVLPDMFDKGVPKHAKRFGIGLLVLIAMVASVGAGLWIMDVNRGPRSSSSETYTPPPP